MRRRPRHAALLAACVALPVLLVAHAPASLLDRALAQASAGRLRALGAEGSLWHGRAQLASVAADGRSAQPWLAAQWRTALEAGALEWRLSEGAREVLHLRLGWDGVALGGVRLDAPVGALLGALPHAYAQAGWRGALRVTSPGWRCTWHADCSGEATLEWVGAGLDLLPRARLGDYRVSVRAAGRGASVHVLTLDGELRVAGAGSWEAGARAQFSGEVSGPPEIVDRLPAVMGDAARRTGDAARVRIELR